MKDAFYFEKLAVSRTKILWLVSFLGYLFGLFLGAFLLDYKFLLFSFFSTPVLVGLFFLLSACFFGYLTFVPLFFLGIYHAQLAVKDGVILVQIIPIIFSVYAGTMLGIFFYYDAKKYLNGFSKWKKIVLFLVVGLFFGLLIEFGLPHFLVWLSNILNIGTYTNYSSVSTFDALINLLNN